MTRHQLPAPVLRSAGVAAVLAIVVVTAFVCWPGIHGYWGRDDFMQLAFARLVGSAWPVFVHDHYVPAPGTVFRPLGFASFWLGEALFGIDYRAHAIADLALHAGVALALFFLLRRVAVPIGLAACSALLFAVHPAVVGTSLWWSARFDLLATLFVLLALNAGFAYREHARAGTLACALAAALAAMLSKETGLAAVPLLSLLWLRWAWSDRAHRVAAMRAVALAWLCLLLWFGWRGCVLGTLGSGITGSMPLSLAIAKGLQDWFRQMPGYLLFWPRLDGLQRSVLALAAIALVVVACLPPAAAGASSRRRDLAVCGLGLVLLPALLQAPVAALNAAPLDDAMSAVEAAMQSRLYYLGVAGVAMLLAAMLVPTRAATSRGRLAFAVPLAAIVLVYATVARDGAVAFAARSVDISAVAREAVSAVSALDLPARRCHVVFLDVDPAPEWSIYVSMDSIVKATSPDLGRVAHCWFEGNYPTWFHLLAAPVDAADASPYRPLEVAGEPLPWRRIGGLAIAYLQPPERVDTAALETMRFLRWRDGRFEDATREVVEGRLAVRLQ